MATPRGYTELSSADAADIEQVNVSLNDIDTDVSSLETATDATAAALAALDTDVEYAYSTWKPLERWIGLMDGLTSGTIYMPDNSVSLAAVGTLSSFAMFAAYIDPADIDAGSRAVKVRASLRWRTNTTAPGQAFDVAVYAATLGGAASAPLVTAVGAAQGGASQSAPASSTSGVLKSSAVTISSAGDYIVGITVGGTMAAGSKIGLRVGLDYQQS